MTRLSSYSSFLTTVHSANSTQEQPVIFCLKSSSNLSKSACTTLPCCGGKLTMLSARINYLHSVRGIIIISHFVHKFWVWYRAIQTDGPSSPLYYACCISAQLSLDKNWTSTSYKNINLGPILYMKKKKKSELTVFNTNSHLNIMIRIILKLITVWFSWLWSGLCILRGILLDAQLSSSLSTTNR